MAINMHDKAALRTEIARLKTENEALRVQLTAALGNTGEAKANARLIKEFQDYKDRVRRHFDEFNAELAKFPKPDELERNWAEQ